MYKRQEKNGIKVSNDICDIFDIRVKKHISNGKLYSQYNLWTTTGRPSNSFGNVNFAALPPEKRKAIVSENDYLVEFDFDACFLPACLFSFFSVNNLPGTHGTHRHSASMCIARLAGGARKRGTS